LRRLTELKIKILQNYRKLGFLTMDFADYTDFWGENGVWGVRLWGLGRIGKVKTFEND